MSGRLDGRLAVVTGAASGIARACALGFLDEGATVIGLDRSPDGLADLERETGGRIRGIVTDVADESSVSAAFARIGREAGRVDVLLNCAAVQLHGRDARAHELDLATWTLTLAVNLTGVFLVCKHAIPLMLERGGSIINCGSPTGMAGSAPGYDAYSTSKGGVMAFSRVLAMDYAAFGIRVNNLVPGATETPLITEILADAAVAGELLAKIPLGRISTPQDYVGLAVHLASDESRFTTGATYVADGGFTAR